MDTDFTPRRFMTYAESYGRAASMIARQVESGDFLPHPVPIGTLALHCVELSLKAVLIKQGMDPETVRVRYGHNIKRLLEATPLDWSDLLEADVEFYSDAVLSQALRYRLRDSYYIMDPGQLLPFMEGVFQRCLAYVMPDAKRTVTPAD
jgi:hypothetical protein